MCMYQNLCELTVVDRIFQLIKENNLTAKEFANRVGVSQGNITDWKTGRAKPSVESLQKIAKYANVSTDWLVGNSFYRNNQEYQSATKYSIAFLESEDETPIRIINMILRELIKLKNKSLYDIKQKTYTFLEKYRLPTFKNSRPCESNYKFI